MFCMSNIFFFFAEFLEGSGFDEDDAEEENDPDLKNDPIFQTNLKVNIIFVILYPTADTKTAQSLLRLPYTNHNSVNPVLGLLGLPY
jgi:hypothetical protein